jgi:hypothetical protein
MCIQDAQCTAGISCERVIKEYTPDEHWDMPLTLGTCKSRADSAATLSWSNNVSMRPEV